MEEVVVVAAWDGEWMKCQLKWRRREDRRS
jgi:hypothetical protein